MVKEHRYKVEWVNMDEEYRVFSVYVDEDTGEEASYTVVHQGSLADCEAFIRLKEGGYL